jgi:hypothetical protein
MTETKSLAEALAVLMTKLPEIKKVSEAKVETKGGGSYKYSYADLAQISRVLLPILGECGLSFIAKPTMTEDGRMVLAYRLRHVTGESEDGQYPLPTGGTPQSMGSAITYARRYCLCAVTGVAPEDDDDGAAAQAEHRYQASRPAPQPEPQWERPLPDPKTDWEWANKLEARINAAGSLAELRGLWGEMSVKQQRGELTADDRATFEEVFEMRKKELEESPA